MYRSEKSDSNNALLVPAKRRRDHSPISESKKSSPPTTPDPYSFEDYPPSPIAPSPEPPSPFLKEEEYGSTTCRSVFDFSDLIMQRVLTVEHTILYLDNLPCVDACGSTYGNYM